jgi:hypothetical protein
MKIDSSAPTVHSPALGSGSKPASSPTSKASSPTRPRASSLIQNFPERRAATPGPRPASSAPLRRASLPSYPTGGTPSSAPSSPVSVRPMKQSSLPSSSPAGSRPQTPSGEGTTVRQQPPAQRLQPTGTDPLQPANQRSAPAGPSVMQRPGSQGPSSATHLPSPMQSGDNGPAPNTATHQQPNNQTLWGKVRPYVTPTAEGVASALSLASALTSGRTSKITGATSGLTWVGAGGAAAAANTATTAPQKIANHALAGVTALAGATSTAASLLQGDNSGAIPSGIVSSTAWGANAAGSMALHAGRLMAGQGHPGVNAANLVGATLNLGGALAGGVASHLTSIGAPAIPAQATSAGLWLAGAGLQGLGSYLEPKP